MKKRNFEKAKRNIIFILAIFIGPIILIILLHKLSIIDFTGTSREFNYKELMIDAKEKTNKYEFVCNEVFNNDQDTESIVRCTIRYSPFKTDILSPTDINGVLEYFVLDYQENENIKLNYVLNYRALQNPAPEYYELKREKNRIIIENKDKRNAQALYYYYDEKGNKYYLPRNCTNTSIICKDSPLDFTLAIDLVIQHNPNEEINIDSFGPIYTYVCFYDYRGRVKNCENNKYTGLKTTVVALKPKKQKTNSNNEPFIPEEGYDLDPERETNIDITNEEEVLALGNRLWQYAFDAYWGRETAWKKHLSEGVNQYGQKYYVCDIKREKILTKYTTDFTMEGCNRENCYTSKKEEFLPYDCNGGGRGSIQTYKNTTLRIDQIDEDTITYITTSEYCGGSFCHETKETVKTIEKPFIIKKVNEEWLIHYFYLPN